MIPLNQKVNIHFGENSLDEWGLPVKSTNVTAYKVRLDFNSNARLIEGEDGKNIIFSANIYFRGAVPIKYTDYIEYDSGIEGMKLAVPKQIFPITDLAGKVIYTKVTI